MGSSTRRLKLLGKKVRLSEALTDEDNILHELKYPKERIELIVLLLENEDEILRLAAQHLNIRTSTCELSAVTEWTHGSFNMCIPIHVQETRYTRVMFRVPLPYKIGEDTCPGNIDEKLRCEAATYIHVRECCPDVPIPMLLGFGFSTGITFTPLEKTSIWCQVMRWFSNRLRRVFKHPLPSPFMPDRRISTLPTGYLLLEYIENGRMLSETFGSHIGDPSRRQNLFKDLSRIMVSLAKVPLPRIGSFTIDNRGFVTLANRPLTLRLQVLENEGIPVNMPRSQTYECTESYALDLLAYHDRRLLCQPNSMNDEQDGRRQMSALGIMRSVMPQFINPATKRGPFFLSLTDLHASNIMVDDEWQITSLIDLEWACSHPAEMMSPPYWLTGQKVDLLDGAHYEPFCRAREEFMAEYRRQEESIVKSDFSRSAMMEENWNLGSFWFFHALETTKGLYNLFKQHIMPRFSTEEDFPDISHYWSKDTSKMIHSKLGERDIYLQQLALAASTPDSDSDSDSDDDTCDSS